MVKSSLLCRYPIRTCLLALLITTSGGCLKRVAPPVPEPGQAPLERALAALERSPEDLTLPKAEEAGYSLPTHYPAVATALAEPLALAPRTEQVAKNLDQSTTPLDVLQATSAYQPGAPFEQSAITGEEIEAKAVNGRMPSPTEVLESSAGKLLLAHFPTEFKDELHKLCALVESTAERLDSCHASGKLRPPALAAEEFFLERWAGQPRYRSHPTGFQELFLDYAKDIDLGCIRRVSESFLAELDGLLPSLKSSTEGLPELGGTVIQLRTNLGPVLIGSRGADSYATEAALILDPGGDDTWSAGAGSNLGLASPLSLAIDLGGNDSYRCQRAHCQGSGFGGVGILMDLGSGNDTYSSGSQSQGSAMLGFGLLWDEAGNDSYEADSYGHGAGTLGVGLLLDSSGNDRALIRARGQGFAATGGLGIFADQDGDDHRRLGVAGEPPHGPLAGGGQGAAWGTRSLPWVGAPSLHGGVGLLYDRSGNDSYYARAYGQGAAWVLSLGMLIDRAGNDRYVTEWFGQGVAQHLAGAVLLDSSGEDVYEGGNTVQAAALDRSVGILWDRGQGNDRYRIGQVGSSLAREVGSGQAWAGQAHALALLVDEGGDDVYQTALNGMGYALSPSRPDRSPIAFFLDLDGNDTYLPGQTRSGGTPAEGATWLQVGSSVGMDTRSAHAGWASPSTQTAGQPGFSYKPIVPEYPEGSNLPAGDIEGDATARWAALEAAYRSRLDPRGTPIGIDLELVRQFAREDANPAVRRAAARLLVSNQEVEGLDVLIDSLTFRSEDTRRPSSLSSLPYWLAVATGISEGSALAVWRSEWNSLREGFDMALAWDRVQALDAILVASGRGEIDKAQQICVEARDLGIEGIRPACAQVLGFWAWVLGHPESGERRDLSRAVRLGQLAISLAPNEAEHFVNLARAFHGQGQIDLARRTLEKAAVLDPDAYPLLALQRQIDDESGD